MLRPPSSLPSFEIQFHIINGGGTTLPQPSPRYNRSTQSHVYVGSTAIKHRQATSQCDDYFPQAVIIQAIELCGQTWAPGKLVSVAEIVGVRFELMIGGVKVR
jgi:hypothetical protein